MGQKYVSPDKSQPGFPLLPLSTFVLVSLSCPKQRSHTRIGFDDCDGNRNRWVEQAPQTTAPHLRQWCWKKSDFLKSGRGQMLPIKIVVMTYGTVLTNILGVGVHYHKNWSLLFVFCVSLTLIIDFLLIIKLSSIQREGTKLFTFFCKLLENH
jgi:hypothetical protein